MLKTLLGFVAAAVTPRNISGRAYLVQQLNLYGVNVSKIHGNCIDEFVSLSIDFAESMGKGFIGNRANLPSVIDAYALSIAAELRSISSIPSDIPFSFRHETKQLLSKYLKDEQTQHANIRSFR